MPILKDGLDVEDMKHFRANTLGHHLVWEMMDTEAFLKQIKHTIQNCEFADLKDKAGTYDHSLIFVVLPILVRRLKHEHLKSQMWERLFRSAELDPKYRTLLLDEETGHGSAKPRHPIHQLEDI